MVEDRGVVYKALAPTGMMPNIQFARSPFSLSSHRLDMPVENRVRHFKNNPRAATWAILATARCSEVILVAYFALEQVFNGILRWIVQYLGCIWVGMVSGCVL